MKFKITEGLIILEKTPSVLNQLLSHLPDTWIYNNEGENTWSPFDIVGHLIHGEETDWIPRTQRILSDKEDKLFLPFDRFAQFENSIGKSMQDLLQEFRNLREKNLRILKSLNLDESKLAKKGTHPDFGEVSLQELLATWVVHDLNHINQITRVLAGNYADYVGPWKVYLGVLKN